ITLSVTGGGAGAGTNYSLNLSGGVTLSGANSTYIFDIANNTNGSGSGSLIVAGLNDGGTARTIKVQNAGTMILNSPSSLVAGSTVNIGGSPGTLRVTNVSGSATGIAAVNVNSGGTLAGSTAPLQGFISGPVTVAGGAVTGGTGTTLTLSGGLTLQSG